MPLARWEFSLSAATSIVQRSWQQVPFNRWWLCSGVAQTSRESAPLARWEISLPAATSAVQRSCQQVPFNRWWICSAAAQRHRHPERVRRFGAGKSRYLGTNLETGNRSRVHVGTGLELTFEHSFNITPFDL